MKRRAFILALGGAAAWPFGVRAEQPGGKFCRIGMLETISPALNHVNFDAFQRALRDLGYVEGDGQNPAGWNPIPIHPLGSPSPHPPIQDKLLIAISESRRALPKSARSSGECGVKPNWGVGVEAST